MKKRISNKTTLLLAFFAAMTFQLTAHNGVKVSPKMYLKGALESNGLMRDALRSKGLLPSTEPYSALPNFQHYGGGGGETVANPAVFQVTGNNAIMDWVVVELRSDNSISTPVSTQSALLQRDGDVVGVNGVSPVHFLEVAPGQYHVSVRHRNHLGVMTNEAFNLTSITTFVDFSSPSVPLYGVNPCSDNGVLRALWLGNVNRDNKIIYQGAANDKDIIFFKVLQAPGNLDFSLNFMFKGYLQTDVNLDGETIFAGPNNDPDFIYVQIFYECQSGSCKFTEQLP